jgi:hypothetical protein
MGPVDPGLTVTNEHPARLCSADAYADMLWVINTACLYSADAYADLLSVKNTVR